jgi:primase-polymerase (primpol)-like protein
MTGSTLPTRADLPDVMLDREQWLCWREQERDGKPTKVPLDPHTGTYGSATGPETWASFATAREYAIADADGIGFVFTDDDPLVGVNLDDCRVPETETALDWATDIVDRLESYTEVSPSGTGVHVIVHGDLPEGRNRKGDVELYETARFFTVTGDHVSGTPTGVVERDEALSDVHAEYVAEESADAETESGDAGGETESGEPESEMDGDGDAEFESATVDLSDADLLERAKNAKNGVKFERLWNGVTTGYDSHSEADMALCSLLAFWTGGDRSRVDRLFRDSGLMRAKWDDPHYSDGSTYGEKTVARAVATTSEYYSPSGETDDSTVDASKTLDKRSLKAEVEALESGEASRLETVEAMATHLQELESEVEELRDRNEQLREELNAERARRRAVEQELEAASDRSVLPRIRQILDWQSRDCLGGGLRGTDRTTLSRPCYQHGFPIGHSLICQRRQ